MWQQVPLQGWTQLWAAGAAFPEAQDAQREKKKLLLQLLLGSLSKPSAWQQRGGVLLAKASSPVPLGNRGFLLQLPILEEGL